MTALRTALLQRRAVLAAGVVGLSALIVAVAVWSAAPPTSPAASSLGAPGSGVAAPSGASTPATPAADASPAAEIDGPWSALDLPPFAPAATLVATRSDRDRVATNTSFTLTSLGALTAAELARAVVVEPSIGLEIKAGADAATATLRPTSPLVPGRLYRFTARTPDGAIAGSWAFQAAAPLQVVTTVPGDGSTNVPTDTGIELTFDQDGTVDVAAQFSIQPAIKGTFEQHGRTVVFVPDGLKPATLYTVTLERGVRLEGSDQILEEDVRVRFETSPTPGASGDSPERPAVWYGFGRSMIEVRPGERATLAVSISAASTALAPRPFAVSVYRLPSEEAATDAVRRLTEAPNWATWSRAGLVSTTGLTRVQSFTAAPERLGEIEAAAFQVPTPLESGWYLVEIPRPARAAQTVLQVTDVGAYTAVAEDRLLVWANDIASASPLAGATVEIAGGDALGQTDTDGVLLTETPAAIRRAGSGDVAVGASPLLAIRTADGRSLVVPIGIRGDGGGYLSDVSSYGDAERQAREYWRYLTTDRGVFRRTDTINVWGFVRPRDGVPAAKDLKLTLRGDLPITTVPVTPDRTGAFTTSITITDLPYGNYTLELTAGDVDLGTVWVAVTEIRKPAYAISLETDRHVVVVGDSVTLTARATFFDGTPVPGASLAVEMFGTPRTITTDRSGTTTVTAAATSESGWISVRPARAEEAEISADAYLSVFPSGVMIEAQAKTDGDKIDLTGSLNEVAIERLEAAWASAPWSGDPKGPPVRGGQVTVTIVERVPVRIRTNRVYDFISKKVVNTYDYRWDDVARSTRSLTSEADGAFQLTLPATRGRTYELALSSPDAAGRQAKTWVTAESQLEQSTNELVPYLESRACRVAEWSPYGIGDPICLRMRDGVGALPTGDGNRYLFFATHRGLRQVLVQDSPIYDSTFGADDVPNLDIWGVRFSGSTFTPVERPYSAVFDSEERRLTVRLTPDRERYAPGDPVTISVRTTDASGAPTSAAVVLRAVDEKLYAIGGASDQDPLWDLYGPWVSSGLLWTHASHPIPFARTWVGGDTAGGDGGGRSEFADSLLFRKVTTDAAGRARVSFRLSDDLTSWRVSASATTAVPEAGLGSILVPVGLPFFVEATLAPEYLAGERPTLRLRAYGSDLRPGDRVTYTVSSTSLGLPATSVRGIAFDGVDVPLPALPIGAHAMTITGSVRDGGRSLSDRLTRRFEVVASRFTGTRTTYATLTSGLRPEGGVGWTTLVFSDAGRGRYLPLLQSLNWSSGARVDQALAATVAGELLVSAFGVDRDSLPETTFDPGRYQGDEGVALLPYSSADLSLTARIALLAGDQFDQSRLANALRPVLDDPQSTRERRILALAGLAGLGEPVLTDLRQAGADPQLTVRERLYVALGLAVLGDDATARAIERDLLGQNGERRGPSIRLRVGGSLDDTIEATSLLALVAAQLGEPFAPDLQAYVDANPAVDELYSLQQVAFVARMLDRMPSASASFSYSLNGKRSVVDLGPGESFSLTLTEPQRRTLTLEPLNGSVGLATSWQAPLDPATITPDPDLTLTRTVLPSGDIPSTAFVEVRLTATFGPQAVAGCYAVTDLVPSGLAPIARLQGWPGYASYTPGDEDIVAPFEISAQRVSFCVAPRSQAVRSVQMRYFARVVSAGAYVWEPAVIQSAAASESLNLTVVRRVTIR